MTMTKLTEETMTEPLTNETDERDTAPVSNETPETATEGVTTTDTLEDERAEGEPLDPPHDVDEPAEAGGLLAIARVRNLE
ncbi:hypothetical protein, partial [Dermacoccus nishinomiyaensis]|uniref:hypothetical protein n=1 Tax=Dermacoccus nishinomiyaensis TaxID=1274 RepID=UPI00248F1550